MVEPFTEYVDDALAEGGWTQTEYLLTVAVEGEGNGGIDKDDALEGLGDVVHLGGIGLEELPASGDIEEEVLNEEIGTCGTADDVLLYELRTVDAHEGAYFVLTATCLECNLGYSGYAGKGFATKAHGMEGEEVNCLTYLGGGMTLEGETGIGIGHATAVVDNLYRRFASVCHQHLYVCGSRIDSVFHEFLDDGGWALYHLACGYLVGYGVGKEEYFVQL